MNLCKGCLCSKCQNETCEDGCNIFCASEGDTRTFDCENYIPENPLDIIIEV